MTDFTILAPDLDKPHARLLGAMLQTQFRVLPEDAMAETWDEVRYPHVLSVGRGGLEHWHDFNLIQVGAHRGCTFRHGRHLIMQLEHPGSLMQLSFVGHTAKDNMRGDLLAWKMILEDRLDPMTREMAECGACRRKHQSRVAYHWMDELDHVGLCDDHWRKRAQLTRKPRPRVKAGTREAQIEGQLEIAMEE